MAAPALYPNVTAMVDDCTFIGIDLAWRSDRNHAGAVALRGDADGAVLRVVADPIRTLDAVRHFITVHGTATTIVAVDAPLIISNPAGQRLCETQLGRRYGAREASCHTSNLSLHPAASSVMLAEALVREGFVHALSADACSNRVLLEVYPHAALVALFDLPKTLKYKRGTVPQKRAGLQLLAEHIGLLEGAEPPLLSDDLLAELLSTDVDKLPGPLLKMHEDRLDAIISAYVAYYYWRWRDERIEIFGDIEAGYIANPRLVAGGVTTPIYGPLDARSRSPHDKRS